VEDGTDTFSGENILNINGKIIKFDDQAQADLYKKNLLTKKISN
tara:strand:+ start:229 stop:360 length:132 start_codon:yes stop_codon:yes gene_type:complete